MKVIFLDVDGVLINRRVLAHKSLKMVDRAAPECVAVLNKLLAETGAKIVVSSSWRIGRQVIELKDIFNEWGVTLGAILDKTGAYQEPRGKEIQAWLDEREKHRGDVDSFVIIDDDADMLHLLPYLVKTTIQSGLMEKHIAKAKEILAIPSK